jgi:hypothetical protein
MKFPLMPTPTQDCSQGYDCPEHCGFAVVNLSEFKGEKNHQKNIYDL